MKVNIYAQSNSDFNLKVKFVVNRTGAPIDLTGYKADMEIRERKEGYVLLAKLSSHLSEEERDGTIVVDGPNGTLLMNLNTNILINKVKKGNWYYDVVLTRPDGLQSREYEGNFIVDGSTTLDVALNTDPQTGLTRSNI